MKDTLHFKPASSVSLDELAAAFNAAFEGYFYPQQLTGASLARRARLEQLDLHHSLVAYDGEDFVGLTLLGLRGLRGWCGGFGIVPEYRGRGCAKDLMEAFMAEARACGLKHLSLEVLARNTPARRLYERAGMRVTRDLLILERDGAESGPETLKEELKQAEPDILLRHFARMHPKPNAWQRDLPTLLITEGASGFYLGEVGEPSAYALGVTWTEGRTHLIDLATTDSNLADALCAGLAARQDILRVVNEPEDSLFVPALLAHGFKEIDRQHEMVCEL
jgi:Acetyltransferases